LPRPDRDRPATRATHRTAPQRGVTLIEVITVMTVIAVLLTIAAPSFHRTIEQAHADLAGANLRAIWNAQRFYWLEHRTYAADLADLQTSGLLDSAIINSSNRYSYAVVDADTASFSASATRIGSTRWTGSLTVDETGVLTGAIQASGAADITPGFQ
jgi:prepilin-type N-terminal cleavage/methylation domain-containing protein